MDASRKRKLEDDGSASTAAERPRAPPKLAVLGNAQPLRRAASLDSGIQSVAPVVSTGAFPRGFALPTFACRRPSDAAGTAATAAGNPGDDDGHDTSSLGDVDHAAASSARPAPPALLSALGRGTRRARPLADLPPLALAPRPPAVPAATNGDASHAGPDSSTAASPKVHSGEKPH